MKKQSKNKSIRKKINEASMCHYFYCLGAIDGLTVFISPRGSKNRVPKFKNRLDEFRNNSRSAKVVTLTEKEDIAYGKYISQYMNDGLGEIEAENHTIDALKKEFPRLKELLTGNYKIKP